MRKILFLLLFATLWTGIAEVAVAEPKKFDGGRYELEGDLWSLQEMTGDINGDEFEDTVRLVVLRGASDDHIDRMWFEVQHGFSAHTPSNKRPEPYLVPLPEAVAGYNPRAELARFVAEQGDEVFLTFDGMAGGPRYFAVVQIRANDVRRDAVFLFDSRTMDRAIVSGNYIGRYLVNIRIVDSNTNFTLDVSSRKDFYEREGVYDKSGVILQTVSVGVTRYEDITIGPKGTGGISTLIAQMGLFGFNDADRLATANCTLKYDHTFDSWRVVDAEIFPETGIRFMEPR